MVIGCATDFMRQCHSFVRHLETTLFYSLPACLFVLAASVFGFVFIVRRPELQIRMPCYFVLIIGLFALFCYTQELEQLGRALIGADSNKKRGEAGIKSSQSEFRIG